MKILDPRNAILDPAPRRIRETAEMWAWAQCAIYRCSKAWPAGGGDGGGPETTQGTPAQAITGLNLRCYSPAGRK